jgi:enamine deaminase RidA (YjgF/YER057c/UK114 family)
VSPRHQQLVQPLGWARPKGYSNGVVAKGRMVFVAGQIGWDPTSSKPKLGKTFAAQFDQALSNALAVVREAGGRPEDLARVTIYVSDKAEYLASTKKIGEAWRKRVGHHYPAMTLVEVSSLLERGAKVEIEVTAVVAEEPTGAPLATARRPPVR